MIQFVTFGTENYEPLLDVFNKSIKLNCKENYVLNYYALNYECKLKEPNLVVRNLKLFKDYNRPHKYKPYIILQSLLDIQDEYFLYLDLDMIMRKNYNSQYFIDRIKDSQTPLSPLYYWRFCRVGEKIWATKLSEEMGFERGDRHHQQNNIIAYTKNHFPFLLDWYQGITDSVYGPKSFGDEEMFNIMLNKYEQDNSLDVCCICPYYVKGDNFYNTMIELDNGTFDKNNFLPDADFYLSKYDAKNIMFYHGVKDIEKIKNYLKTLI